MRTTKIEIRLQIAQFSGMLALLPLKNPSNTLIRLRGCTGWSEYSIWCTFELPVHYERIVRKIFKLLRSPVPIMAAKVARILDPNEMPRRDAMWRGI